MKASGATWKWMFTCGFVGALTACGGGGGGGSDGEDFNVDNYPTPPAADVSGLTAPTRTLVGDRDDARDLLVNLRDAFPKVHGAVALQALGQAAPRPTGPGFTGSQACPQGGEVNYAGTSATLLNYTYVGCRVGSYTYNGDAVATVAADGRSYTLTYDGLDVAGQNLALDATGITLCQAVDAAGTIRCTSRYPTGSPVEAENLIWGWDSSWDGVEAEGTHQCGCTRTWNVTYDDFSTTSGKATILGSNGVSYIDRLATNRFNIRTIINGTTYEFLNIGLAN